jgi:NAD(P)-dependent dehydrogenase (short-subunit alcohol dehydrogenase family)
VYLITGGGSGIGRALARALVRRDKQVLVIGRREDALAETAAFSSQISILSADVSTTLGRNKIVAQLEQIEALEGLIHNAGVIEPILPIQSLDETAWLRVMSTNLNAPLFLTQSLRNKLNQGRVLHIGSGAAYFPVAGWSAYCVSKAGLSMLTRCWQLENPDFAIASVMPGIIDTEMQDFIRKAECMEKEKRDFFVRLHNEKKLLSVETVAEFLTWLLLDLESAQYASKEWDIYDKSHHQFWLKAPQEVPDWES